MESVLADIFGVTERPSAETADAIYDQIAALPGRRLPAAGAGSERFGIECWRRPTTRATTCVAPRRSRRRPDVDRPGDPHLPPGPLPRAGRRAAGAAWPRSAAVAGRTPATSPATCARLRRGGRYFEDHGAVSADHSHLDARAEPLDDADASRIYAAALRGDVTVAEATAFRRHMVFEMARMSTEDGLVMTLHPGVHRNHHAPTTERFGPDSGNDIPVQVEYTRALQPLLDRFGTAPGFHLILFTLDETVFSREIAPLAGFYPSVYAGAPWWFLDAPEAVRRFRSAVTETAGFARTSGFIDDTRAFCSIPARHDMSRRLDSGYLAQLVAEHRLDEDEAHETVVELVTGNPRKAFKL